MKSSLPHLSDAHLMAIAHVSVRSAQVDQIIELVIVELMLPNVNAAEKIIKTWSQNRLVELVKSLLLDKFPWYSDQIDAFISEVETARSERNKIIHFIWGKTDPDGAAQLASFRPFRKNKETSKTASQVGTVADDLLAVNEKLVNITYWAREQRIASPSKLVPLLPQGNYPFPLDQNLPDKPTGI